MLSVYLSAPKPGRREVQVRKSQGESLGGSRRETEGTSQNSPFACWHQPYGTLGSCTSTCNPLEMEQVYYVCNISCTDLRCFYVAPAM